MKLAVRRFPPRKSLQNKAIPGPNRSEQRAVAANAVGDPESQERHSFASDAPRCGRLRTEGVSRREECDGRNAFAIPQRSCRPADAVRPRSHHPYSKRCANAVRTPARSQVSVRKRVSCASPRGRAAACDDRHSRTRPRFARHERFHGVVLDRGERRSTATTTTSAGSQCPLSGGMFVV